MLKSSLGFHTMTLFMPIKDPVSLITDFLKYSHTDKIIILKRIFKDNNIPKSEPFVIGTDGSFILPLETTITYRNDIGIQWKVVCAKKNQSSSFYTVEVKINPKILAGIQDYLTAASYDDMETAIAMFNTETKKISPLLQEFSFYTLSRIDYCINFSLSELIPACSAEQIMYLIKKSNIPSTYREWMQYDEISHRWKSKSSSFYLINRSVHINCYSKYLQLKEKSEENIQKNLSPIPSEILDKSRDILRFEVQCLYHKTHSLLKKTHLPDTYNYYYEYENLFKAEECISQICRYYEKTIGRSNWYTLQEAIKIIIHQGYNRQKETRLIEALQLVNQCRSIPKAKESCGKHDIDSFKRTLKELSSLGINPVTIPKEWGIKHIPNLLTAYIDKVNDKKQKNDMEKFQMEVLEEYVREYGCLPT